MANNPYVNKVVYGNSTVMDISDTDTQESDVANGKVFYKGTGARSVGTANLDSAVWGNITGTLSNQTDLQSDLDAKMSYADNGVLGAKNFCESKLSSATVNGITLTKNNNGSYTISGTNDGTANSTIRIDQSSVSGIDNLKGYHGDYILSLLDANKNYVVHTALTVMQNSTWSVAMQAYSANNGVARGSIDKDDCFIYITISQNADFTTPKTVYPMLRLASDPDNTYVPYAMTNKELTDSKANASDLDGWTATSQVANGQVTFTGLDDTQGWGYDPRIWVDNNSTNLNPYCRINSMTGAGTANMSITYDTDADNGAYVRLRIIK